MQQPAVAIAEEPEREFEAVRLAVSQEAYEESSDEEKEFVRETEIPAISRTSKTNPLLRSRWMRRLLRLAGLRPRGPLPTCAGVTRRGQPCRGMAMANGFCRLHGGSRNDFIAQETRTLLGRLFSRAGKATPAVGR